MIKTTYSMEVPFFDVDSLNIAWHGHYVKYLELARCQLLDQIGYNYDDMKASGFAFPIVDLRLKYVKPLCFRQHIDVIAELTEWQVSLKINYRIVDQTTQEKLTTAYTTQAAVNLNTMAMQLECPKAFTDKVTAYLSPCRT